MPPAERKSGIPEATETPAPVKNAMDLHFSLKMSFARLAISTGVVSLISSNHFFLYLSRERLQDFGLRIYGGARTLSSS